MPKHADGTIPLWLTRTVLILPDVNTGTTSTVCITIQASLGKPFWNWKWLVFIPGFYKELSFKQKPIATQRLHKRWTSALLVLVFSQ